MNDRRTHVLIVCKANVTRSQLAAALLQRDAVARGLQLDVSSAGIMPGERVVDPTVARLAADLGMPLEGRRSRVLDPQALAAADLVVTMSRELVRQVVVRDRTVWNRTFTLPELVRIAAATPAQPGTTLAGWLALVGQSRQLSELVGARPEDDVDDPTGGPRRGYVALLRELEQLVPAVVDLLAVVTGAPAGMPQR
jgi:protein-tyrosine-phosphatase